MEGICVNFLNLVQFFSDSSRDVAMATNFVLYRTCSLGAEVSQDPLDRFSQSLHHMVGIELQMIDTSSFFPYFKGRCHGNQFSGKMGQNYLPPALIALSFRNGMAYRLAPLIALHRAKRW